ncbi:MAG: BamA/TamA family outer membrane protein, partial [Gammaproteobacteria bacterium]
SLEARYGREDRGDLETRTTRFQPAVTHVLGDWQRVASVAFTQVTTVTAATATQPESSDSNRLIIPGLSYASVPRGYLGEALFSRGFFAELRGSTKALGAADDFIQLRLEGERVFELAPKWHAFLRSQLGTTWVSATEKLPGTERFFAGGDRRVRGFGFTDLSPLDAGGAKIGGRHLFTGTAEVIRDLPRNLALALFVDTGNAFDAFGDPLQYSAGIGIRFRLPVVSVGIDLAQPLTNPACRSITPDPRCTTEPGFKDPAGPRLHINFSPKL